MTTIANVLTEDTDSRGDRVLALEEYKVHYNMTRDTSLRTKSEWVHRFSCKDVFMTWIVGQIHASAISRNYCTTGVDLEAPDTFCVLTIKCPETADRPSKQFFQKQIAALETVLEKDVSDGQSWKHVPADVGTLPGQLVKVHLSLTRDHAADGTLKPSGAHISNGLLFTPMSAPDRVWGKLLGLERYMVDFAPLFLYRFAAGINDGNSHRRQPRPLFHAVVFGQIASIEYTVKVFSVHKFAVDILQITGCELGLVVPTGDSEDTVEHFNSQLKTLQEMENYDADDSLLSDQAIWSNGQTVMKCNSVPVNVEEACIDVYDLAIGAVVAISIQCSRIDEEIAPDCRIRDRHCAFFRVTSEMA
ncbi:hypothetical protein B0H10DRAFT_1949740 [Mycena sp. CBHHK59/15]|nr:hypothetical protein B0H10DRAFT_1949740 [Mycena sp. CBHHK59/15]